MLVWRRSGEIEAELREWLRSSSQVGAAGCGDVPSRAMTPDPLCMRHGRPVAGVFVGM